MTPINILRPARYGISGKVLSMYLIVIAWLYVTVMMALAEAFSPQGSILGAIITFLLYGLLPISIVAYILNTPARKRRLRTREAAQRSSHDAQAMPMPAVASELSELPDAGSHAAGAAEADGVPPVGKEP